MSSHHINIKKDKFFEYVCLNNIAFVLLFAINIFHVCDIAENKTENSRQLIISVTFFKNKSIEILTKQHEIDIFLMFSYFFHVVTEEISKCGLTERLHSIDFWLYAFERASSWVNELRSFHIIISSEEERKVGGNFSTSWFLLNVYFSAFEDFSLLKFISWILFWGKKEKKMWKAAHTINTVVWTQHYKILFNKAVKKLLKLWLIDWYFSYRREKKALTNVSIPIRTSVKNVLILPYFLDWFINDSFINILWQLNHYAIYKNVAFFSIHNKFWHRRKNEDESDSMKKHWA